MIDARSKLAVSRELLEEARALLHEDSDVHERLRHVLNLTIEAFIRAESLDEPVRGSKIVRLVSPHMD